MDLSASEVGAHVPFVFWRQRSLREARTETTTLRVSGFSGLLTAKLLPSARAASAGWASWMAAAMASEGGICLGSVRTDIVKRVLERGSTSGLLLRTYGTDVGR